MTNHTTPTHRTIANRPIPTPSLTTRTQMSLRTALGPGFQSAPSEHLVRQAVRR